MSKLLKVNVISVCPSRICIHKYGIYSQGYSLKASVVHIVLPVEKDFYIVHPIAASLQES